MESDSEYMFKMNGEFNSCKCKFLNFVCHSLLILQSQLWPLRASLLLTAFERNKCKKLQVNFFSSQHFTVPQKSLKRRWYLLLARWENTGRLPDWVRALRKCRRTWQSYVGGIMKVVKVVNSDVRGCPATWRATVTVSKMSAGLT